MTRYTRSGAGHVRGPRHVYVPGERERDRVAERANIAALVFVLAILVAALAVMLWYAPGV